MDDRDETARSAYLISLSQLTPSQLRERFKRTSPKRYAKDVRALIWRNFRSVQREGSISYSWDISGDCMSGYTRTVKGSPELLNPGIKRDTPCFLDITTRCRRCENCCRARAALWRMRAKQELHGSFRTWFGTFTLSPEQHFNMLTRARQEAANESTEFDSMPAAERFARLHNEISRELTLYLKRVRKRTGAPFKYLIVAEAHKSGLPHYHALFHEKSGTKVLRYDDLKSEWKLGFTKFNLVTENKQATYLCKYLSKSMDARVRASIRYGQEASTALAQAIADRVIPMTPHNKQRF